MSYRTDLPPIPGRMKKLPVHRGYPVPWFVKHFDGVPDFRILDYEKQIRGITHRLCLICGQRLPKKLAFVLGPMALFHTASPEAPSCPECARFAAAACPFLARPNMVRREDYPEHTSVHSGAIEENPGLCLIYTTTSYDIEQSGQELIFNMGLNCEPVQVLKAGQPADQQTIFDGMVAAFARIAPMALMESRVAVADLITSVDQVARLLKLDQDQFSRACSLEMEKAVINMRNPGA